MPSPADIRYIPPVERDGGLLNSLTALWEIGRRLVDMAVRNHGAAFVDVNEQNPAARAFYEKLGFVESGRTETDGQGNPFPIIEMRRKDFHIQTKDLSTKRT